MQLLIPFKHLVVCGLAWFGLAVSVQAQVNLQPPRMVLNRSLFLTWDKAPASGFTSYEVFASTQAGFTPANGNRVQTLTQNELHYVRLYGLSPNTPYYFRVRVNSTLGSLTSGEVTATTLVDGVNETRVPTVMYHHVQPRNQFPSGYDPGGWVSTENFSRDMAYLKAHGVNPVGHQEILDRANNGTPLPPNPVFLTFDDGFVTYISHALPILLANDFHSVNAIVTRRVGGSSTWAVPEWPLMSLMTWSQIKDCQRQGMWMGSHTQTHIDLNLEPNKAYEIAGSRNDMQNEMKVHPRYFCYPWGMGGKRNQTILNQVSSAGYTLATRTWPPEIASIGSDKMWFPRVFANENDSLRAFLVKLDLDTDKDGIKNHIEMDWGLNGATSDTDGDGLSDGFEVGYDGNASTYNPHHPTTNPGGRDLDAKRTDTDLDGLSDFDEIYTYQTNPLHPDTDGDGITDSNEISVYGTNPRSADTDLDGMTDYYELSNGFNPLVANGLRPYIGGPFPVSACIEAENFNFGGPGVAYADTTATNLGNVYRRHEYVDLAADNSASNQVVVGWTAAGEWLSYSINVPSGGFYKASLRVAAVGAGGAMSVSVNGTNVTGNLAVPNTGGWSSWTLVTSPVFYLDPGQHVVRVSMVSAGSSGFVAAFDRICFLLQPPPVPQGPFGGGAFTSTVPGVVEAEHFDVGGPDVAYSDTTAANDGNAYRLDEFVDIGIDAAASNGFTVGWTKAGEWMEYTLQVVSSGTYQVATRVAAVGNNGSFRIELNGSNVTGAITVPNTGAWNSYQDVTRTNIPMAAGVVTLRVVMVANGTSGFVGSFDQFRWSVGAAAPPPPPPPPPPGQSAFPSGTPWPLPGVVELENFDNGGAGVAYNDTTTANEGGQYRTTEAVDISNDAGAGNGRVVGWTKAGEWMEYTVQIATAGTFDIEARVAAVGNGGQFRVEFDGVDKTGNMTVPNTGAWNAYAVVARSNIALAAGVQTVRVAMVANGGSGFVAAMDWFRVTAMTPVVITQTPYVVNAPWPVPGAIEVENFDRGGPDVAFSDTTPANLGGQYRTTEGVDIAADPQASNGFVAGWTKAGEWMEYTFDIQSLGAFGHVWRTRVAGQGTGGLFRIEVDGVDVTGSLVVPNTGAWNVYQEVEASVPYGALTLGVHTARLVMVRDGASGFVGAFDRMTITEAAPPPPSIIARGAGSTPRTSVIAIQSRDEAMQPGEAWSAVDGDPATLWRGRPGRAGWWLAMTLDRPVRLDALEIDWAAGSPTNVFWLVSADAVNWLPWPATDSSTASVSYIWLLMPDAGGGALPAVRELRMPARRGK